MASLEFLPSAHRRPSTVSGYSEFTISEAETVYAITIDDRLITHITVANTPTT